MMIVKHLPEVFKLNEVQNSSILGMYCNFLRDFLRVDLEGNITNTHDVPTKSKLNEYLSSLFKGISETATKERTLDEYMNTAEKGSENQKSIGNCSICNNHSSVQIHQFISPEVLQDDYLESTLEILQQFYIKMHSDHK